MTTLCIIIYSSKRRFMKNLVCFDCGQPAHVEHHVVPRSKGGKKTVPLCNYCHSLVHDAKLISISELSIQGKILANEIKNQETVLRLFKEGVEKTKIAKQLNISRNSVYNILKKNGLYQNEGKGNTFKITPDVLDEIKKLRESGNSWNEIETKIDICHTHLYRIIKQFGWYDGKYGGKSKQRESYKTLTEEKIEIAKQLRAQNKSWDQIASEIGVDRTTLYKHKLPQQFKPIKGQLTKEKKLQAQEYRKEGKTWKEIAALLEVSLSAIYMSKTHKEQAK